MVFQVILPILILLLMGYCSVLIKLVTPEQIKALSAFVIKISLPAFLIQSLANKTYKIFGTQLILLLMVAAL